MGLINGFVLMGFFMLSLACMGVVCFVCAWLCVGLNYSAFAASIEAVELGLADMPGLLVLATRRFSSFIAFSTSAVSTLPAPRFFVE